MHIKLGSGLETAHAARYVGLNHTIVDERREGVGQKHGEHGSLGITVVVGAYEYCDYAYEQTVDVFACAGACGCHRVGGHEDCREGKTSVEQLVDRREERGRIGRCLKQVGYPSHQQSADDYAEHDAPRGYACEEEQGRSDEYTQCGCLAKGAGDESYEGVPCRDDVAAQIEQFEFVAGKGCYLAEGVAPVNPSGRSWPRPRMEPVLTNTLSPLIWAG